MHRSLIKIGTFFPLLTFDQERGRVETKLILIAGIYTTYATACIILDTCNSLAPIADESVSNANKFPLQDCHYVFLYYSDVTAEFVSALPQMATAPAKTE